MNQLTERLNKAALHLESTRGALLDSLNDSDAVVDLLLHPIIGDCAELITRVRNLSAAIETRRTES